MTKKVLKRYLQQYVKIVEALQQKELTINIRHKEKKIYFEASSWMYKLPMIIQKIKDNETSKTIKKMIKESIEEGKKDREVLNDLAISESTYYRWKQKILEKIFNLYILCGEVKEEEIMIERID